MVYAEKGNRVKSIEDEHIDYYVEQGYRIVSEAGVVLQEAIPTGAPELRLAYKEHTKTIKALNETIAQLKAKVSSLESELQAKAQQPEPVKETAQPVSSKRSRKSVSE